MRISDWSSDVCSSDLQREDLLQHWQTRAVDRLLVGEIAGVAARRIKPADIVVQQIGQRRVPDHRAGCGDPCAVGFAGQMRRSEARRVGKDGVRTGRARWSRYT